MNLIPSLAVLPEEFRISVAALLEKKRPEEKFLQGYQVFIFYIDFFSNVKGRFLFYRPASDFRSSTLSVFSQLNSISSRPKCP